MTDKEIFANEILCIKRRASGRCNGGTDCNTCDLLMDDTEIIEAYQRAMKNNDLINRLQKENADLFFKLQGVMHSVDKWLDGDELKQDEANRAATMREKTLQITEKQQAEIERLQHEILSCNTKIEVLQEVKEQLEKDVFNAQRQAERVERVLHLLRR